MKLGTVGGVPAAGFNIDDLGLLVRALEHYADSCKAMREDAMVRPEAYQPTIVRYSTVVEARARVLSAELAEVLKLAHAQIAEQAEIDESQEEALRILEQMRVPPDSKPN